LTSLRSALVQQRTLAKLARQLRLGDYLLLGKGEEESGGRTRPVTLCATFEAVLGALYRDQGIEAVKAFLLPLVRNEMESVLRTQLSKDPKSRLQEWAQSELGMRPRYETLESLGPDHDKVFTMQVSINSTPCGVGRGRSKQAATQAAAAMALHRLKRDAPEYEPDPALEEQWDLPDVTPDDLKA
jgi:ribonuclease-3